LDPTAEHDGGSTKEEDRDREDPTQLGQLPVACRRLRDAQQFCHWQVEYAECVSLPDTQMHTQRSGRHHPPAEAGFCNRMTAVEKAHCVALLGSLFLTDRGQAFCPPSCLLITQCGWAFVESINVFLSADR